MSKKFLLLPLWVAVCTTGCHFAPTPARHQLPNYFVSGTYAIYEVAIYCTTWDTIYINRENMGSNEYWVDRKTTYQRNVGIQYFDTESYFSSWKIIQSAADTIFTGLASAPDIWFSPSTYSIRVDGIRYNRIN